MITKIIGCPNCQSADAINFFNWELTQQLTNENHKYVNNFQSLGNFKFGELYKSVCCGSKWYLHAGIFMYLVTPLRQKILDEWSRRNLTLSTVFKNVLASIGSNLIRGISVLKEYPVMAKFEDEKVNEFCIITLTTLPPGFEETTSKKNSENYVYIDQVRVLEKSKFALPGNVRKNTTNPIEIGMGGYAPIFVMDNNGHVYKIPAFESFSPHEIPGPIIIVDTQITQEKNVVTYERVPILRIIADPF
ncbi:MAG: hypothetical protein HQK53_17795 [Oligoflexia bacterium]|nr:hypothetical protein [Oligoflexia bacterium]